MKNLSTAIYEKWEDFDSDTDIVPVLYKGEAPDGAQMPYVVFMVVSDVPEYPGGKTIERVLVQFSIFSAASSTTEIEDILTNLRALYDDCSLSITSNSLIYFIRGNMIPMRDEIETVSGATGVWHYAQEYEIEMVK